MMQRMFLTFAIAILASGCGTPRVERLWLEDFEELCDGTPCDWTRVTGTAEQATWVETIHPGEHGLQLIDDVSVAGIGSETVSAAETLHGAATVRCDPGSTLTLELLVGDISGRREFTLDITSPSEWGEMEFNVPDDGGFLFGDARVSAAVFNKSGSGSCEISEIYVDEVDALR